MPHHYRREHRWHLLLYPVGIAIAITGAAFALSSKEVAMKALVQHGYTHFTMTGWEPFGLCGKGDIPQGFRSTTMGKPHRGYVCVNPYYTYIIAR